MLLCSAAATHLGGLVAGQDDEVGPCRVGVEVTGLGVGARPGSGVDGGGSDERAVRVAVGGVARLNAEVSERLDP